jgi:hypothetical protein
VTLKEVQSYFEDMLGKLWPNWKTNDVQISVWAKALKHFSYPVVRRATEEHFTSQEGSYGKPKLYAIIAKARLYQPVKKRSMLSLADYEPDVFVQCVENEKFPNRVYSFHAIIVEQQHLNNRDYILQAAEDSRRKCEHLYGGRWVVQQKTCYSAMYTRLAKYRTATVTSDCSMTKSYNL